MFPFSFFLCRTAPAAERVSPVEANLIKYLQRALRSMAAAGKLLRHQKENLLHGSHGTFSRKGGGTWLEFDGAAWLYDCQETGSRRIWTNPLLSFFFFLAYLPRQSSESVDSLLVTFHSCHYISELVGHQPRRKVTCTISNLGRQGVSNLDWRQKSLGCQLGILSRDTSPVQRTTKTAGMTVLFNKMN